MRIALGLITGLLPLFVAAVLWRRSGATRDIPAVRAVLVAAGTYALAWGCQFAELGLWSWTGLSLTAEAGRESEALLAMFLFAAPLEEGAKVLGIWPLYSARRLLHARHGIVLSAVAGAGFAAGETSSLIALGDGQGLTVVRALLAIPPHVLCAVMWGTTLGARARTGWFALAWAAATLLHGLFDHIVFGRGPGVIVLAAPLLLTMLALAYAIARKASSHELALGPARRAGAAGPGSAGWSEPPSVRDVWQALEPKQEPLMLHWIALGTLVTAGIGLVTLGAGLYAGHAMGLDFAAADEADVRSNGPLLFLATAVGTAFPIAGYLVARASGARSVLEPGLGAALAVLGAVLFLSVTTPIAAVVALALAPIAFVLAATGAWFAMGG
jgi:RsiW-degrading membrane proteinase PrsW (M82 family)